MTTTIREVVNELFSGHCWHTFNEVMPKPIKQDTILKTAAAAIAAGIIMTALRAGALGSFLVSAVVGIGAFAYITTSYGFAEGVMDHLTEGAKGVKNQLKEGARDLRNNLKEGVKDLRKTIH